MPLTRAHIAQIAQKLKRMPPPPAEEVNATKQEAVRLLAREIAGLQRKGYSLEQITASLKGEGLDLATPTLKSYLSRAKTSGSRRRGAPTPAPPPKRVVAPLTEQETTSLTGKDAPAKSGKDAFLVKDKDSY